MPAGSRSRSRDCGTHAKKEKKNAVSKHDLRARQQAVCRSRAQVRAHRTTSDESWYRMVGAVDTLRQPQTDGATFTTSRSSVEPSLGPGSTCLPNPQAASSCGATRAGPPEAAAKAKSVGAATRRNVAGGLKPSRPDPEERWARVISAIDEAHERLHSTGAPQATHCSVTPSGKTSVAEKPAAHDGAWAAATAQYEALRRNHLTTRDQPKSNLGDAGTALVPKRGPADRGDVKSVPASSRFWQQMDSIIDSALRAPQQPAVPPSASSSSGSDATPAAPPATLSQPSAPGPGVGQSLPTPATSQSASATKRFGKKLLAAGAKAAVQELDPDEEKGRSPPSAAAAAPLSESSPSAPSSPPTPSSSTMSPDLQATSSDAPREFARTDVGQAKAEYSVLPGIGAQAQVTEAKGKLADSKLEMRAPIGTGAQAISACLDRLSAQSSLRPSSETSKVPPMSASWPQARSEDDCQVDEMVKELLKLGSVLADNGNSAPRQDVQQKPAAVLCPCQRHAENDTNWDITWCTCELALDKHVDGVMDL